MRWTGAHVVAAQVPLICVLPTQSDGIGPHALVKRLLRAGPLFHRHADLAPAVVAHQNVALDGHTLLVYADRKECQAIRVAAPDKGADGNTADYRCSG